MAKQKVSMSVINNGYESPNGLANVTVCGEWNSKEFQLKNV